MSSLPPLQDLHSFRASHPLTTTTINNIPWQYIACGHGPDTLLLLPGAPGRADTAFQHILALETTHKIIAPSYPPQLATLDQMLHGLSTLLSTNNIPTAHIAGGSYSGLIAQAFVRHYPNQTSTLILSDTGIPRPDRAEKYTRYLHLLKALPLPAIRTLWRLGSYKYLQDIATDKPFWRAYFKQMIATITKQECVGRLRIWIEFDQSSRFTPNDLAQWPGKVLILESADDATFPPQERAALLNLYPHAQTQTFPHGGHAASISHRHEYINAMQAFLHQPTP